MRKIIWANLLHIYQPPNWSKKIIAKVAHESYQPLFKILLKRPKTKITLNIAGSLTEQLARVGFKNIINTISLLARRGQIEFTGSAQYHPILPLISEKEIARQIDLNNRCNQKYFGKLYQPKGFFPPEMAINLKLSSVLRKLGFEWLAADEIGYNGKLTRFNFDTRYFIKGLNLSIVFRNHHISNQFFEAPVLTTQSFLKEVKKDKRNLPYLITALDGENLGHHRKGADKILAEILDSKEVETTTISNLLKKFTKLKVITPKASSWSSFPEDIKHHVPYSLWYHPENEIHQLQWRLTKLVIDTVNKSLKDKGYDKARELLDQRINSDQYWWASAQPWWSDSIVIAATRNLEKTLKALKKPQKKALKESELLTDKIIKITREWQDTGKAHKMSHDFLNKVTGGRYFGGEKLN